MVSACTDMIDQYYKKTGETYPGAAGITCEDPTSAQKVTMGTRIKVLGRQFDTKTFETNGADGVEDLDLYLLHESYQGFINNTEVNMTVNFDQVQTNVGSNAFLNSDFFAFSARMALNYIQVAGTRL